MASRNIRNLRGQLDVSGTPTLTGHAPLYDAGDDAFPIVLVARHGKVDPRNYMPAGESESFSGDRPLSDFYATLADAQADYPWAIDLDEQTFPHAVQKSVYANIGQQFL